MANALLGFLTRTQSYSRRREKHEDGIQDDTSQTRQVINEADTAFFRAQYPYRN
jgi:hypothetical protein